MPKYLLQFTYSNEALGDLIKHPQDRAEVISELFGRLGGKVESFYFSLGEYDVVVIAEFPDNETMAAITNAVRATGAERDHKITILLTREEAIMALRRAGSTGYQPPS